MCILQQTYLLNTILNNLILTQPLILISNRDSNPKRDRRPMCCVSISSDSVSGFVCFVVCGFCWFVRNE